MTSLLLIVLLAFALDRLLPDRGGFRIWDWYSDWAESIEQRFNGGARTHGVSASVLAIVPLAVAVFAADYLMGEIALVLQWLFRAVVLYFCLDFNLISQTAQSVAASLEREEVGEAADQLAKLTGKDTVETTGAGVAHAAIEAILRQTSSLVVSPVFWFLIFGPLGAVVQRMAAVLDRQWGHPSGRFAEFGWAAARFDDVLNWIPARITAISYAVMGSFEDALYCWRKRAGMWSDINSGPVLASGFGALHLGSCEDGEDEPDVYGNKSLSPEVLPDARDVQRAVALVWRVTLFWLAVGILMAGAHLFGFFSR